VVLGMLICCALHLSEKNGNDIWVIILVVVLELLQK